MARQTDDADVMAEVLASELGTDAEVLGESGDAMGFSRHDSVQRGHVLHATTLARKERTSDNAPCGFGTSSLTWVSLRISASSSTSRNARPRSLPVVCRLS